jgi:hypothetical protein
MDYHQPTPRPRFLLLDANDEPIDAAAYLDDAVCPDGGGILDTVTGDYLDERGLCEMAPGALLGAA